jgi:hypothetical protein
MMIPVPIRAKPQNKRCLTHRIEQLLEFHGYSNRTIMGNDTR